MVEMEAWVLGVLCTVLVLGGAAIGGTTVYAASYYRQRKRGGCCKRHAGPRTVADLNCVDEEHETQMTAAEKSTLQRILHTDGTACLSLRLPDSTLSMPTVARDSYAVSDELVIVVNESPSSQTPQLGPKVPQSPQSAVTGLGVVLGDGSVMTESSVVADSPDTNGSATTATPAVAWTSPVDDKSRRSIIRAVPETMGNIRPVPYQVSLLVDGERSGGHGSPRSAALSVADSHCGSIGSAATPATATAQQIGSPINTPATAHLFGSPCSSTDYVVVPPSPSITSLYGASLLSPRSVGMSKSVSSPGGRMAPSLLSPRPRDR
ncbi:hypothetical protein GGF46_003342 [Coemansia sp. RSA 552]|nr:hypothetical protein GGF46_003342 [Coemansia sp. RSA 552]